MITDLMKNSHPKYVRFHISDTLKRTIVFVILICGSSLSLFGQIINPYVPSTKLDSLYESIQSFDTLFYHSNKGVLETYRDEIAEIKFIKGRFNSLRMCGSQCAFKNQDSDLTFQNENGQIFTIHSEPNNLIIKGPNDSVINILEASRKFVENTNLITNVKRDYYNLPNIFDRGGVKISTVCDTNFRRVREIWVQFPDYKSLHIKTTLIETMPFAIVSFEKLSNYSLTAFFNRYGQVGFIQISNSKKNYTFWINFRSKRKPKKISTIDFILPSLDQQGDMQYPAYMVYSYKRNGRIKENRLKMNYHE